MLVLPIGGTGSAAAELAKQALAAPEKILSQLDKEDRKCIESLAIPPKVLGDLLERLATLVAKLQGKHIK